MRLVNETSAHRYGVSLQDWQVSLIWSFIVSIFCIGGLLGSLVASPLVTSFGRWVRGAGWDSALLLFFDDALTALQETMLSAEQLCDHHWSCADAPQHNRQVLRDDHGGAVYLRHQRRWGWGNGLRLFSSRVFSSLIPSLMGFAITLGPPPPFVHQAIPFPLIDLPSTQIVSSSFTPSGIGLSVHSIYLVECAPKRLRGMVGVTIATFASFGKFFAQLLGIRWAVTYTPGESSMGSSGSTLKGQLTCGRGQDCVILTRKHISTCTGILLFRQIKPQEEKEMHTKHQKITQPSK